MPAAAGLCHPTRRLCPRRREPDLAAPQVCKRWYRVFYSNHCRTVWQRLERQLDPFEDRRCSAAKLRVWQRVGPLLQGAAFTHCRSLGGFLAGDYRLPDYLATLEAERLLSLRLNHVELSAWALHMVGQFCQLRELDLRLKPSFAPPYEWALRLEAACREAALLDTISHLTELRRLSLEVMDVDAALAAAISRLPRLQSLALHTLHVPLPVLSPLIALASSLTSLCLVEHRSSSTGLRLLPAAAFPNLQQLTIAAPALQVGQAAPVASTMWPLVAVLHRCVACCAAQVRSNRCPTSPLPTPSSSLLQVPWGGTVEALHYDGGAAYDPEETLPSWAAVVRMWQTEAGATLSLQNARLDSEGAAAALLATVAPAAGSLETLRLTACCWSADSFGEGAPQLAAVQRLVVQSCTDSDMKDSLAPALGVLLQQVPQLRSLEVRCGGAAGPSLATECLRSGPPPEVATLRHLTSLELYHAQLPHLDGVLEQLPGGRWWRSTGWMAAHLWAWRGVAAGRLLFGWRPHAIGRAGAVGLRAAL